MPILRFLIWACDGRDRELLRRSETGKQTSQGPGHLISRRGPTGRSHKFSGASAGFGVPSAHGIAALIGATPLFILPSAMLLTWRVLSGSGCVTQVNRAWGSFREYDEAAPFCDSKTGILDLEPTPLEI